MEVDISRLRELLKRQYLNGDRDAKLVLGPPGIGKSVLVKEVAEELARELGKEFIEYSDDVALEILESPEKYFVFCDIRLTEVEPADLIGIPREVNGEVMYKPLMWGRVMSKCAGILFLDELTNVQRLDVQAAMYKLLLDKKVGFLKMHKDVMVIAAGNRPEDSAIAVELPAPAINRVDVYVAKAASIDKWKQWMDENYENKWDKRVYAFLKKYPKFFIERPDRAETLEQYATPRRWTSLALITDNGFDVNSEEFEYVVISKVGRQAGSHFLAFVRVPVLEVDVVLKDPTKWTEISEESKYMTMVQLVAKFEEDIKAKKIEKYKPFIKMLLKDDREFMSIMLALLSLNAALMLGMAAMKDVELRELDDYIKRLRKRVVG